MQCEGLPDTLPVTVLQVVGQPVPLLLALPAPLPEPLLQALRLCVPQPLALLLRVDELQALPVDVAESDDDTEVHAVAQPELDVETEGERVKELHEVALLLTLRRGVGEGLEEALRDLEGELVTLPLPVARSEELGEREAEEQPEVVNEALKQPLAVLLALLQPPPAPASAVVEGLAQFVTVLQPEVDTEALLDTEGEGDGVPLPLPLRLPVPVALALPLPPPLAVPPIDTLEDPLLQAEDVLLRVAEAQPLKLLAGVFVRVSVPPPLALTLLLKQAVELRHVVAVPLPHPVADILPVPLPQLLGLALALPLRLPQAPLAVPLALELRQGKGVPEALLQGMGETLPRSPVADTDSEPVEQGEALCVELCDSQPLGEGLRVARTEAQALELNDEDTEALGVALREADAHSVRVCEALAH